MNATAAQTISIVPKPASCVRRDGVFCLDATTVIVAGAQTKVEAEMLAGILSGSIGARPKIVETEASTEPCLRLEIVDRSTPEEGYRLQVTPREAAIRASSSAGIFYGLQTLLQMMPPEVLGSAVIANFSIPCIEIEDAPRFKWRGAMLDVARYFFPVDYIKRFIDLLAMHKMNVLHLHLTDDQGWRLQIKKYPRLTSIGGYRRETLTTHLGPNKDSHLLPGNGIPHSGFYTQDEAREIVEYARRRHIVVVPEIELPGHARAAIAAYPEFGTRAERVDVGKSWGPHEDVFKPSPETFAFLENILIEVLDIFPSTFIHIGGDEVIKDQWEASDYCRTLMAERDLKDAHELQSYFIRHFDTFLAEHGRRLVGWDEILEGGLAPGATVMSWRGERGGTAAASAGHDVVMTPESYTYLDLYQAEDPAHEPRAIGGYLPLEKAYAYNPIPSDLPVNKTHHVLGAQAQIWTEYISTTEHLEYMAFPRLCALAEAMWTQPDNKDLDDFISRLQRSHLQRLDTLGVGYRPLTGPTPLVTTL
jgi:hexosaminidase